MKLSQKKLTEYNFFFLNKFLFSFSSNLQTLNSKLKKKFFLQENDQKANKQKSYYKDTMHTNMFTLFY